MGTELTAQVKLIATSQQAHILTATLQAAHPACNWISQIAWETGAFRQVPLHHLVYYPARERFGLPSHLAVRCIVKVVASYKRGAAVRDHKQQALPTYRSHGL